MLEALGEWMGFPMYYAIDGAAPPPRSGASHATIYPYGPFATGDGKAVLLGVQNEREWVAFCEQVLQRPSLVRDARFVDNAARNSHRDALQRLIVQAFSTLGAAQVIERLDAAQIANARMNTMHDFWQHPQLAARGRWTEVGSPVGPLPALLPPGNWDDGAGPRMDPVPALGQHTDALLTEIGYDAAAVAQLRANGAV